MVLHKGDFCSGTFELCRRSAVVNFHAATVCLYRLGRFKSVGLVVSKLEKPFDAHVAKDSSREFEHEEKKYFVPEIEVRQAWCQVHREYCSPKQRECDESRVFENKRHAKIRVV